MDSYRDMFRVILELSNDKASSTVYFMLVASCLTARTYYYRMKSNSTEVVAALTQNEPAFSPSLISLESGIKVYYLDGYHVTLDVKAETTIKELCAQVMHGMKMGLYEVENEFGPSFEQRLLDGDMTVGQLADRWKSLDWPNAKLIAPIYLKEWSTGSPERQVHFEKVRGQSPGKSPSTSRQGSRSASPATFLSNFDSPHGSPVKNTSRAATPEGSNGHANNGTVGATPTSASPGTKHRRRSPGTTARGRTNALINTLFNNNNTLPEERVPCRRAETPTGLPSVAPIAVTATPAPENAAVGRPTAHAVSSPANRKSPAASPASAARRDAAPSRRQSSSHTAVSPRMNTASTLRTASAARTLTPNRDGRYGFYNGSSNISESSATTADSSAAGNFQPTVIVARRIAATGSSPSSRQQHQQQQQLTYPREVTISRSSTPTNTAATQTPPGTSPERNFTSPRGSAVSEMAASTQMSPEQEAQVGKAPTLSQEFENEFLPVSASPEKIRPRTTYVQIAGSAQGAPTEGMTSRGSFESSEEVFNLTGNQSQSQDHSQSGNIFDLNNSPPLRVPTPAPAPAMEPVSGAEAQLVKAEDARDEDSPATTSSGNSGNNTPSNGNGLSPYPSWRGSSSALPTTPDLTVNTPPQAAPIHALYSRLFGAPAENDFTLPLSPVATSAYHSPPKPKNIIIDGTEVLPRYSRSSSPAGSVCSNAESVTSTGGTRHRSKSRDVLVRPPFDTSYNGPSLSQLLSSSGDGNLSAGRAVSVDMNGDDNAAATSADNGDISPNAGFHATPTPAPSNLPPRYVTPTSIRKTPAQSGTRAVSGTHSASRLPRKVSNGAMSESESSVLSHGSRGAPRPAVGATPGSATTHKKKSTGASAHTTPQSTNDKPRRTGKSGAAFGHCITPTSATIREAFEAKHGHPPGMSAEQAAAALSTQSYAQLHGGYVPHKRPSGTAANGHKHSDKHSDKHGDSEHSHLDSDGAHSASRRPSTADRYTSPHSVHSGGGSRPSSALRSRNTPVSGTWRP